MSLAAIRPDTWTVLSAAAFVIGAIFLAAGVLGSQGTTEWRSIYETPDLVPVEASLVHRFREEGDRRGALELWRYTFDARVWYHFESDPKLRADPDPPPLLVDPARPWRPIPADRSPPRDLQWATWPGVMLLGFSVFGIGMRWVALRRRIRLYRKPLPGTGGTGRTGGTSEGKSMAATIVQVRHPAHESDRFVIDMVSLDGTIRVSSPALWIDPRPFLPENPQIIQVSSTPVQYEADLSFLPEVRFA